MKEFTASLDAAVGSRGSVSGTYIFRRTGNLIEDYVSLANGVTHVVKNGTDFGTFTNVLYANSDVAKRQYQGLQFEGLYRVRRNWSVNGHYTLMLQDDGNYEGEAANIPGQTSIDRQLSRSVQRGAQLSDGTPSGLPAAQAAPVVDLRPESGTVAATSASRV